MLKNEVKLWHAFFSCFRRLRLRAERVRFDPRPTRKSRGHPFFWKRIFTQFCLNSLANIIFLKFRFDKINTQRPHLVPISLEYVSIIFFWLPYRLYFLPLLLILKVLVNRIWTSDQRDTDARTSTFDKGVHMDVCDNVEQYLDPKIEYGCTLMSVACAAGTLKSHYHVNMSLLGCNRVRMSRFSWTALYCTSTCTDRAKAGPK